MSGLRSDYAVDHMANNDAAYVRPSPVIPRTIAGRMELIAEWLYGIPVVSVCPCGCGLEVDTGRREPLITKETAARLMEVL